MTTLNIPAAIRRFPLVAWARPACPSLPERVADIATRAVELRDAPPTRQTAESAAALLNLAALIASDCRDSAFAKELCHRHLDTYLSHDRPLTYTDAPLLLGPATNLARLRLRANDGDTAVRTLVALLRGVRHHTDAHLDGRTLPLSTLHGPDDDHQKLMTFAWLQLLTDGTKALTLAGRWADAAHLVDAYNGCGLHPFEGRQVTIISRLLDNDRSAAQRLLDETVMTEPWEHEAGACLQLLLADPEQARDAVRHVEVLFDAAQGRTDRPHYRARFAATAATLAEPFEPDLAASILDRACAEVLEAPDGYAAREVLNHPAATRTLSAEQIARLRSCVEASGLDGRQLTGRTLASLMDATTAVLKIVDSAFRQRDPDAAAVDPTPDAVTSEGVPAG